MIARGKGEGGRLCPALLPKGTSYPALPSCPARPPCACTARRVTYSWLPGPPGRLGKAHLNARVHGMVSKLRKQASSKPLEVRSVCCPSAGLDVPFLLLLSARPPAASLSPDEAVHWKTQTSEVRLCCAALRGVAVLITCGSPSSPHLHRAIDQDVLVRLLFCASPCSTLSQG